MKRLFIISLLLLLTPLALIRGEEGKEQNLDDRSAEPEALFNRLRSYYEKHYCDKHICSVEYEVCPFKDCLTNGGKGGRRKIDRQNTFLAWLQVSHDKYECPEKASEIVDELGVHPDDEMPYSNFWVQTQGSDGGSDRDESVSISFFGDTIKTVVERSRGGKGCDIGSIESLLNQGGNPDKKPVPLFAWSKGPGWHGVLFTAYQVAQYHLLGEKMRKDNGESPIAYDCAQKIVQLLMRKRMELKDLQSHYDGDERNE